MSRISLSRFNYIAGNSKAMPYACEGRQKGGSGISYNAIKHASYAMLPAAFRVGPR